MWGLLSSMQKFTEWNLIKNYIYIYLLVSVQWISKWTLYSIWHYIQNLYSWHHAILTTVWIIAGKDSHISSRSFPLHHDSNNSGPKFKCKLKQGLRERQRSVSPDTSSIHLPPQHFNLGMSHLSLIAFIMMSVKTCHSWEINIIVIYCYLW